MAVDKGWSLDSDKWEMLASELTDSNWKQFPFEPEIRDLIPAAQGIYIFSASPPDGDGTLSNFKSPIYIGISENLKRRFREYTNDTTHLVYKAKKVFKTKLIYHFLETDNLDRDSLENLEEKLVKCFGPSANEKKQRLSVKLGRTKKL